MHLIPRAGLRVVDPATRQALPARGTVVDTRAEHASYWLRRVAEGDVSAVQGGLITPRLHEGAETTASTTTDTPTGAPA